MPQVGSNSSYSSLLKLRAAVAFLGEKPQAGWWDSAFLNPVGFQYLGLIYPKMAAAAALTAASEAACRLHDERIGRGRVGHLFRLTAELRFSGVSDVQIIGQRTSAPAVNDRDRKRTEINW
jgi:hypothetical protein